MLSGTKACGAILALPFAYCFSHPCEDEAVHKVSPKESAMTPPVTVIDVLLDPRGSCKHPLSFQSRKKRMCVYVCNCVKKTFFFILSDEEDGKGKMWE